MPKSFILCSSALAILCLPQVGCRVRVSTPRAPVVRVNARPAVKVRVYSHGHRMHLCKQGCVSWKRVVVVKHAHGHRLHLCKQGCASWRAVVVFKHPHGHHQHLCKQGCVRWKKRVVFKYSHGHRMHLCKQGCASWKVIIRRR